MRIRVRFRCRRVSTSIVSPVRAEPRAVRGLHQVRTTGGATRIAPDWNTGARSPTVAIMDGTGIRIRSAAASEYAAIGELTHAAYTHDYDDLPAHYREELKH